MSVFYSIRNKLEAQAIGDLDFNNQFLAAIVSSYPCLDIWVRPAGNVMDMRVVYIQKDASYVATRPQCRNGESPKAWKQYSGTWDGMKSFLLGVLSELSRLHSEKRHGLHNFGGMLPYTGGGLVSTIDNDGTIHILGRFGFLTVTIDGLVLPFSQYAWAFDGCVVEITIDDAPDGWVNGNINDRPVQNISGGDNNIDRRGTLSIAMQQGRVVAYAPSYVPTNEDGSPATAVVVATWQHGQDIDIPLGGSATITAPAFDSGYSFVAGQAWPSIYNQSSVQITASCSTLLETTTNTWVGALSIPFPRFVPDSVNNTKVEHSGVASDTTFGTEYYKSFGAEGHTQSGVVTVVRSGTTGAYSYAVTWVSDVVGYTFTFGSSLPTTPDASGLDAHAYNANNEMGCDDALNAASVIGGSTTNYDVTTMHMRCDTEGVLSTPPTNSPQHNIDQPSGRVENFTFDVWRSQLVIGLPA